MIRTAMSSRVLLKLARTQTEAVSIVRTAASKPKTNPDRTSKKVSKLSTTRTTTIQFKCPKCSFASADKTEIKKHLKIEHNSLPYTCPHCQTGFTNLTVLNKHIKDDHKGQAIVKEPFEILSAVENNTSITKSASTKAVKKDSLSTTATVNNLKKAKPPPKMVLVAPIPEVAADLFSKSRGLKLNLQPREILWPLKYSIYPLKTGLSGSSDYVHHEAVPEVKQVLEIKKSDQHFRTMQEEFDLASKAKTMLSKLFRTFTNNSTSK